MQTHTGSVSIRMRARVCCVVCVCVCVPCSSLWYVLQRVHRNDGEEEGETREIKDGV